MWLDKNIGLNLTFSRHINCENLTLTNINTTYLYFSEKIQVNANQLLESANLDAKKNF